MPTPIRFFYILCSDWLHDSSALVKETKGHSIITLDSSCTRNDKTFSPIEFRIESSRNQPCVNCTTPFVCTCPLWFRCFGGDRRRSAFFRSTSAELRVPYHKKKDQT